MHEFLRTLLADGQVVVTPGGVEMEWSRECNQLLVEADERARMEIAGEAPSLNPIVGRWAATVLAQICQLTVWRDASLTDIDRGITIRCPAPRCPETDYSADIFLQQLPALAHWVHRLAPNDPLLSRLISLGEYWPLSSVGMKLPRVGSIASFSKNEALLQLYVDRIIATNDHDRLREPKVQERVSAALGAFPELAPELAATLKEVSQIGASW